MIYGIDISNWQKGVDYGSLKRNGIEFAIIKSTEGNDFKDAMFSIHLNGCKNAGMIVAAYHYVRGSNAEAQLKNIKSVVPKEISVILDIEDGAGDMNSIRKLLSLLNTEGYKTPLIYIPEWYWNKIGKPSLNNLPPNWWSWYPDNSGQRRNLQQGVSLVPTKIWSGFGGLSTAIVQFTSTGRIPGYSGDLDLNAYRGTKEDLNNLFTKNIQSGGGGGEDMPLNWDSDVAVIYKTTHNVLWDMFNGQAANRSSMDLYFAQILAPLQAKLDGLIAAVSALSNNQDLTVDQVRTIINDAVENNLKIVGTVEITGDNQTAKDSG